jgi:hypothetical protein
MSICRALVAPCLCVSLAALSSYGCDDGTTTRIGPSSVKTDARFVSESVSVPSEVSALAVPAAFCPFVSPFLAPVSVAIRAGGASGLQLRSMQLQFVDTLGVRGAFRTIDGAELTNMFGSTLVPAFGSRTFPVSLPFGCVGGATGTLFIQVAALDLSGRQSMTSVRVNVR